MLGQERSHELVDSTSFAVDSGSVNLAVFYSWGQVRCIWRRGDEVQGEGVRACSFPLDNVTWLSHYLSTFLRTATLVLHLSLPIKYWCYSDLSNPFVG
ncbi:hypothetical protein GW17_00034669 [Ensete ventricosum]|nr:hypothetical protein GW17_00034669 [Ensete ventricosum]